MKHRIRTSLGTYARHSPPCSLCSASDVPPSRGGRSPSSGQWSGSLSAVWLDEGITRDDAARVLTTGWPAGLGGIVLDIAMVAPWATRGGFFGESVLATVPTASSACRWSLGFAHRRPADAAWAMLGGPEYLGMVDKLLGRVASSTRIGGRSIAWSRVRRRSFGTQVLHLLGCEGHGSDASDLRRSGREVSVMARRQLDSAIRRPPRGMQFVLRPRSGL